MKTKLTKILTIVFAASMLLTGCNNSAESNNSIESNNKLTIVTSFYPMYISTLNIVKDILHNMFDEIYITEKGSSQSEGYVV